MIQQEKLFNYHVCNGLIDVYKLEAGTYVEFSTKNENFELEVATPSLGICLISSDRRFVGRDKVKVLGSIDPLTKIYLPKIIGENLKLKLRRDNQPTIVTRPIVSARIIGKNMDWDYKLWV
jgi:hypothetical protein